MARSKKVEVSMTFDNQFSGKAGSKPRGKSKKNMKAGKPCVRMQVRDVRIGDLIASTLAEDPFTGALMAYTSFKVEEIDEAGAHWRTHVNINKKFNYDVRSYVHVVI